MPVLAPIDTGSLEEVCRYWHTHLNPRLAPEAWQRAFAQRWITDAPHHGHMLRDGEGHVVGALGGVFSRQLLGGVPRLVCNISSWHVQSAHRSGSVALLLALLAGPEPMVYTALTCRMDLVPLFERLGFRRLDPALGFLPAHPWPWGRTATAMDGPPPTFLPESARRVWEHHAPWEHLHQVALGDDAGWCHGIWRPGRQKRLAAARLLHLDHGGNGWPRLARPLAAALHAHHGVGVVILPRCLAPWPRWLPWHEADSQPRLALWPRQWLDPTGNAPAGLSLAYSELAALAL
ncbi:MAG: hypothetical protein H7831_00565 [Magnetococcus sp. WYHC-3]